VPAEPTEQEKVIDRAKHEPSWLIRAAKSSG